MSLVRQNKVETELTSHDNALNFAHRECSILRTHVSQRFRYEGCELITLIRLRFITSTLPHLCRLRRHQRVQFLQETNLERVHCLHVLLQPAFTYLSASIAAFYGRCNCRRVQRRLISWRTQHNGAFATIIRFLNVVCSCAAEIANRSKGKVIKVIFHK